TEVVSSLEPGFFCSVRPGGTGVEPGAVRWGLLRPGPGRASFRCGGRAMRPPRFRVRTLMVVVGVVASLVWGAMMGSRSYDYSRRAREYGASERGWREIAARDRGWARFGAQCAEYYAQLARKYRRAVWRPWMPVAPDPPAP